MQEITNDKSVVMVVHIVSKALTLLIEDYEWKYGDLMHGDVRWLSHEKVCERFLSHIPKIYTFLDNKARVKRPTL